MRISECASHAVADARIGGVAGKGAGEQSLARPMLRQLAEGWLLIADRNFCNWQDWCAAADTGAALLWRVKSDLQLPVLQLLPDGSCRSVLVSPKIETGNRQLKTYLRGPGRVLRSQSPDMVRQEIYGYLLAHYAISALICQAATEADAGPDRVKFKRTVRLVRRRVADPAFPLSSSNAP